MRRKNILLIFLLASLSPLFANSLTNATPSLPPEKVIHQRLSKPILLDHQTLLKTDSTDASLTMNIGQNKGQLPGSSFQTSQKIFSDLKLRYENNLLLPYWAETVSADRYIRQNRLLMEWSLISSTSFIASYTAQSEHDIRLAQSLSESTKKEFALKGTLFHSNLWETGYRLLSTDHTHSSKETDLWYTSLQHPLSSNLAWIFQSEFQNTTEEQQTLLNSEKRLHLGTGANLKINPDFSAQIRFDLKMQEDSQTDSRTWVPEEKRVSFSIKGAF